ncbi:hypothetical protein GCK32_020514, partial [Trichostrongylus colubriformis]
EYCGSCFGMQQFQSGGFGRYDTLRNHN